MNNKFEEAIYINGNIHRTYTIEEVSALRRNNNTFTEYLNIKEHLFCPECEVPHLAHRECDSSKDYFATYPNQNHTNSCSYTLNRASSDAINSLKNDNNIQNLKNRLAHCIELLFHNNKPEHNPFIISDNNKNANNTFINNNCEQNRYYIPRKLLTNYIDEKEIETPKIYYGNCHFKWFNEKRLCIYHIEQNRLICSLEFRPNAYLYLDEQFKKNEFSAYIAFLSEFKPQKVKNKTFYNATIYDSRTVYLLIHE